MSRSSDLASRRLRRERFLRCEGLEPRRVLAGAAPQAVYVRGSELAYGQTDLIRRDELLALDNDNSPSQVNFTITSGPSKGKLERVSAPGVAITSFTQADINQDRILFRPNAGSGNDEFFFRITDGTNTLAPARFELRSVPKESPFELIQDLNSRQPATSPEEFTQVGGTTFFVGKEGLWRSNGAAAGTVLVKEFTNRVYNLTNVSGTLFFTTSDWSTHTTTLWRSNGSEAGTVLVKNLSAHSLTNLNGKLLFDHEGDLWQSDGTPAGTTVLKDFDNESPSGGHYSGSGFSANAILNGKLYFGAYDGPGGSALWETDGTAAGTKIVKNPADDRFSPKHLFAAGGRIFFTARSEVGDRLWISDGTEAGTVVIKNLRPGSGSSYADYFTEVNGDLYFVAYRDDSNNKALWKSDGTTVGTVRVRDGAANSLENVNGTLFFTAFDLAAGDYGLWKAAGTSAQLVKELDFPQSGAGLVNLNGTLFLSAKNDSGNEYDFTLWKTDGTVAGTLIVGTVPHTNQFYAPASLTNVNGTLFFSDSERLWTSNGSAAGTREVGSLSLNTIGSNPADFTEVNGTYFFTAEDGAGRELWKTDGTAAGTVRVKDIYAGAANSYPGDLTNVNGTLFFTAIDAGGRELWKSDGTASGTTRVKDINPGAADSSPHNLFYHDGTLYFSAANATTLTSGGGRGPTTLSANYELWKSDGTAAGTVMVADLHPGERTHYSYWYGSFRSKNSSSPRQFTEVNGTLFFAAYGPDGRELWVTDGTAAGTSSLGDLFPGEHTEYEDYYEVIVPNGSDPLGLTNFNGTLLFSADGDQGRTLWKSNGTPAGTVPVNAPVTVYDDVYHDGEFIEINGKLLFAGKNASGGTELWKTDGTAAGTVQVADTHAGAGGSYPDDFINVSGTLFFTASTSDGFALWKSNGEAAGTEQIKVFDNEPFEGLQSTVNFNGELFFTLENQLYDPVLWRSDGTSAGTAVVTLPGDASSVRSIANLNGSLFLSAKTEMLGSELYRRLPISLTLNPLADRTLLEDSPAIDVSLAGIHAATNVRVTSSNPTLIPQPTLSYAASNSTGSIRFKPISNQSGQAVISVILENGGLDGDLVTRADNEFFSRSFRVTVKPVNDAPLLSTSVVNLGSVLEDAKNPAGVLVSSLVAGASDVDAGAVKGIAVSSANNLGGTWQYSLNGNTWLNIGDVSRGAVRLLPANGTARVRLVPKANFNGTASLWFFAWDRTQGTAGGTANLAPAGTTGGTTAFSNAVTRASLNVTPVNDAPVLKAGVAVNLNPIAEDTASPVGTLVSSLVSGVTDGDAGAAKGIAVSSANNTAGTWQYTLNGTNWLNFGAVSRGAVRLLPANATTRVRLIPKANFNGTASIWFFAWDQTSGTPGGTANLTPAGTTGGATAFSTAVRQALLSVTPVNDAPVLGGISGTMGYKRNGPAVVLAPNATVADLDSTNFGGGQLRVRITQGGGTNNTLALSSSFTVDAGNNVRFGDTAIGKRLSNGVGTNELKIQFYSTATRALVQQLIRNITYKNVGGSAGTRTIAFTVSDGDGGLSDERIKTVNVT